MKRMGLLNNFEKSEKFAIEKVENGFIIEFVGMEPVDKSLFEGMPAVVGYPVPLDYHEDKSKEPIQVPVVKTFVYANIEDVIESLKKYFNK